jgi:hypothetical protein
MAQHPNELETRWVCRERNTTDLGQVLVALALLELADKTLGSGIGPGNSVVQRLSSLGIPHQSCFSLIGETDCLDVRDLVALFQELLCSLLYTGFDRSDEFPGVVLVPTVIRVNNTTVNSTEQVMHLPRLGVLLLEFNLVHCYRLTDSVEDDKPRRSGSLINCANEVLLQYIFVAGSESVQRRSLSTRFGLGPDFGLRINGSRSLLQNRIWLLLSVLVDVGNIF